MKIFTAPSFPDGRGFLLQSWVASDLDAQDIPSSFRQASQTHSKGGVVRGLHFQWSPPMGKLERCLHGAIGQHVGIDLTGRNHGVNWVPPGFAHGTCALGPDLPPIVSERDAAAPTLAAWLVDSRWCALRAG